MGKKKARGRKGRKSAAAKKTSSAAKPAAKKEKKELPSKEAGIFKHIIKMYETKQYKKGLKQADTILKKFPNHGETLAMKGLTLNCMGRKEEAHEFVKEGLKQDPKSHVCWHVYGLLFRSDQEYGKAIRSYKMALRIEPKNLQILKDLSLMQIQTRDIKGFLETRRELLQLKSNQKNNWIGFAIAHHLAKQNRVALSVMKSYRGTKDDQTGKTYASSEIIMYENMILQECGTPEQALAHLDEHQGIVKSRMEWVIARAALLVRLERYTEAQRGYVRLVRVNQENYGFHRGLQYCMLKQQPPAAAPSLGGCDESAVGTHLPICSRELTPTELEMFEETYTTMQKDYPKARLPRFVPLLFSRGKRFEELVEPNVRRALRRAMPSYINELKAIYRQAPSPAIAEEKQAIVEGLLARFYESLSATEEFSGDEEAGSAKEDPQVLLHVLLLQAQHLDLRGLYAEALKTINEAIAHTPTLVDLYLCKARILKHMGDIQEAAEVIDHGRTLDLADRYINSKCTKYLLRANQVERADATIGLFLKTEGSQQTRTLFDMQCMWYEIECGHAYRRRGEMGKALKKFMAVKKHFGDIHADQFDFHTYCLRKTTLRAYVRLLRLEDQLQSHPFYVKASEGAVQCYMQLAKAPQAAKLLNGSASPKDLSALSASERKKKKNEERRRKRKELADSKKAEAAAKLAAGAGDKKEDDNKAKKGGKAKKKVDPDPNGAKLAAVADPMAEAAKISATMQTYCPRGFRTNLVAFDVALRRQKFLLALQALRRATAADPAHAEIIRRGGLFLEATATAEVQAAQNPTVLRVLRAECEEMLGTVDVKQYARACLDRVEKDGSHRHYVAAVEFLSAEASEAGALLLEALRPGSAKANSATVGSCLKAQAVVERIAPLTAAKHRAAVDALFPRALAGAEAKPPSPPDASATN